MILLKGILQIIPLVLVILWAISCCFNLKFLFDVLRLATGVLIGMGITHLAWFGCQNIYKYFWG